MKRISVADVELLKLFLKNLGTGLRTFRYYESRPFTVLDNHIVTFFLMDGDSPVAYGHLDKEGDKVWLGTATIETMQGKGYGKLMVSHLLMEAKRMGVSSVFLTVDKINNRAISLYKNHGFYQDEDKGSYYIYKSNL